jgi:hypothetical protein
MSSQLFVVICVAKTPPSNDWVNERKNLEVLVDPARIRKTPVLPSMCVCGGPGIQKAAVKILGGWSLVDLQL